MSGLGDGSQASWLTVDGTLQTILSKQGKCMGTLQDVMAAGLD